MPCAYDEETAKVLASRWCPTSLRSRTDLYLFLNEEVEKIDDKKISFEPQPSLAFQARDRARPCPRRGCRQGSSGGQGSAGGLVLRERLRRGASADGDGRVASRRLSAILAHGLSKLQPTSPARRLLSADGEDEDELPAEDEILSRLHSESDPDGPGWKAGPADRPREGDPSDAPHPPATAQEQSRSTSAILASARQPWRKGWR